MKVIQCDPSEAPQSIDGGKIKPSDWLPVSHNTKPGPKCLPKAILYIQCYPVLEGTVAQEIICKIYSALVGIPLDAETILELKRC